MTSTKPDCPASPPDLGVPTVWDDPGLEGGPYADFPAAAQDVVDSLAAAGPEVDLWLVTASPGGHPDEPQTVVAWTGTWPEGWARQTAWSPDDVAQLLSTARSDAGSDAEAIVLQIDDGIRPPPGRSTLAPVACLASPLLDTAGGVTLGAVCGVATFEHATDGIERLRPAVAAAARLLATLHVALPNMPADPDSAAPAGWIERDPATGLRNSHGLATAMRAEQERCRLFGSKAALLVIDLLPAAQPLASPVAPRSTTARPTTTQSTRARNAQKADLAATWMRVVEILTQVCHACDIGARVDAGRFVVLAVESDLRAGTALGTRLRRELRAAGLHASIGVAARRVGETMDDTLQRAACNPALHTHLRRPVPPLSVAAPPATVPGPRDPELHR